MRLVMQVHLTGRECADGRTDGHIVKRQNYVDQAKKEESK